MSEGVKKPLYQLVQQDSRNAARVGNMIGGKVGQTIEDEADYNTKNPGHAITKAAETFAAMYGGAYLGDASGAGGTTGGAGTAATTDAAPLFSSAAMTGPAFQGLDTATTSQLAQQAIQQAAMSGEELPAALPEAASSGIAQQAVSNGLLSGPGYLGPGGVPAAPGMQAQASLDAAKIAHQAGYTDTPTYLKQVVQSHAMNLQPSEFMAHLRTFGQGGANSAKGNTLALQTAQGLLSPQSPPQMPPPMRSAPAPDTPLPRPYGAQPGQPAMSGLQPLPTYAELLRRRQLMGY